MTTSKTFISSVKASNCEYINGHWIIPNRNDILLFGEAKISSDDTDCRMLNNNDNNSNQIDKLMYKKVFFSLDEMLQHFFFRGFTMDTTKQENLFSYNHALLLALVMMPCYAGGAYFLLYCFDSTLLKNFELVYIHSFLYHLLNRCAVCHSKWYLSLLHSIASLCWNNFCFMFHKFKCNEM